MQKVFEKIIEKLEEEKMSYFLTIANIGDEKLDCAYEQVENALDKAIEIVKQEAEQYSTKNCSECSRRKFYQIGYAEGKKNGGWISCSERLPEDYETYLVTNVDSFGQRHTYKGWYGVEHKIWHMEGNSERKMNVVAWQPLPQPYQQKGEMNG